jgi:uncharacterized damage-inducible protein DinB
VRLDQRRGRGAGRDEENNSSDRRHVERDKREEENDGERGRDQAEASSVGNLLGADVADAGLIAIRTVSDVDPRCACRSGGEFQGHAVSMALAAGLAAVARSNIADVDSTAAQVPLEESIALLERTPRVLHELLAGLPAGWLTERDTPNGWTARDVVGHLISAELDDWIPRAETILNDGTSRAFDTFDRFAHVERDKDATLHQLLDRFAELRAQNIGRMRELVRDDDDLDRRGLHPELGEVTLGELIATWTVHDLNHIAQIYAALAGARDAAVGPWKEYLGILLRREGPTPA